MAYGVNAPFGLRPFASINGGSWTEKVNEYYIYASANGQNTYGTSIFTGDPVVWGTSVANTPTAINGGRGTIAVYQPNYQVNTPSTFDETGAAPILGVFMGCEYLSTVNGVNNLIKSAYWPGGAQVVPGSVIKAFVLDDPNVIYDVQVSTNINANGNAFVANPVFPNTNATGGAPFALSGTFGRNFALLTGGGDFSAGPINPATGLVYPNNPAGGNTLTGQSGFYLCVNTTTAAGQDRDYNKNVTTLPLRALTYTPNPTNLAAAAAGSPFVNVLVTINNPVYAIGSAPTVYIA